MKVMLLKDVYNLGRAGDIKKVAAGYGRNYLIPHGLAVLATKGALKQSEHIREKAAKERAQLNEELGTLAEQIEGLTLIFSAKASETGTLYGSISPTMIAEAIEEEVGVAIDRRNVDVQPIKTIGEHKANVRLTIDLIPEVNIIAHREGESPESVIEMEEAPPEAPPEDFADLRAELEAEEMEGDMEDLEEEAGEPQVSEVESEVNPGEDLTGEGEPSEEA